jgi:hypothetical protein
MAARLRFLKLVNRESALLKHMFNMAERWGMNHGANPVRW